ncbi:hypothetical protein MA20_32005 [Bradyrhizobium japonicum]|uniref:Uncharacterized protein n=1 Tax=Bradyrhizobium japonicum TaxID=375 RepID=A0A0A3XRM8_BRAJP|nr:hypothetical protein MA20_32005 [Bradyrhizobium japonicum]
MDVVTDETRESPETCPTCRRYTETGRQQLALQHRARPLSCIDLSRPLECVIDDLRREMVALRGKLNDVKMGFTGWAEQIAPVEGLLTCGIVSMFNVLEDAREHRQKWENQPEQGNKSHQPEGER